MVGIVEAHLFNVSIVKNMKEAKMNKAKAILEAIRKVRVGDDVIIHNTDGSIWCILTKKCEEHELVKETHNDN